MRCACSNSSLGISGLVRGVCCGFSCHTQQRNELGLWFVSRLGMPVQRSFATTVHSTCITSPPTQRVCGFESRSMQYLFMLEAARRLALGTGGRHRAREGRVSPLPRVPRTAARHPTAPVGRFFLLHPTDRRTNGSLTLAMDGERFSLLVRRAWSRHFGKRAPKIRFYEKLRTVSTIG